MDTYGIKEGVLDGCNALAVLWLTPASAPTLITWRISRWMYVVTWSEVKRSGECLGRRCGDGRHG